MKWLAFRPSVGTALAFAAAACSACSSPAALLGQGGECLQTTDCQEGLVCVPPKAPGGAKTCSMDLRTIVSTEEAGAADARARDGSTEGGEAGAARDGGAVDAGGGVDATLSVDARPEPPEGSAEAGD